MILFQWFFPFGRDKVKEGRFTNLRAEAILKTIGKLEHRIEERFPESGLLGVCQEFHQLAIRSEDLARRLQPPIWPVRVAAIMSATLLLGMVIWGTSQLVVHFRLVDGDMSNFLQGAEAATSELIFLSLALFFLLGLETRIKRSAILKALHRLRSIAHVVDMHQLTKDPAHLLSKTKIKDTSSSPKRTLTRFQITRYLDYCSELLALNAKVAALFAQRSDDTVVLTAVNDLEMLAQGLSGKIWQKIMILDLSDE